MAKRTPNYVLVLLLFAAATAVTYWARTRPVTASVGARLDSIPTVVGTWQRDGTDTKQGKDVLNAWYVNADNFLSRSYTSPNGARMDLMVVYKGRDRRGWHCSEMCFSGSGYDVKQGTTMVPYAGRDVSAVKLVAEYRDLASREIAVYWFAQGKRTESNFARQQLSMALSRLKPSQYGWAFIRVTSPVVSSDEETLAEMRSFIRTMSPALLDALTGGGIESAARADR